jgi:hypothetical protein
MDLFGKVHQLVDYGLSFHQKAVFLLDFSRGSLDLFLCGDGWPWNLLEFPNDFGTLKG